MTFFLIGAMYLLRGAGPTARVQMVFCDAPYDVPIIGHICGSGAVVADVTGY